jgi:hypothetical protein
MGRESIVNTAHRGAFVLERYELRVTLRCLSEDLGIDTAPAFEQLMDYEIIKALVGDRASDPASGKTVGPEAGKKTLYRLGYGNDHRGATWWDEAQGVVWLCAYHGKHRSGSAEDSFPYFEGLIRDGRMMPTADDYARLFEERDEEFNDFVFSDAQALLSEARENQGVEVQGIVGGQIGAGVVVEVVETAEEVFVAFRWRDITDQSFLIKLLAAFAPDSTWEQWRQAQLPTRQLNEAGGETCFSYVKD